MPLAVTENLGKNRLARMTGGLYLGFILASVLADLIGHIGIAQVEKAYGVLATNPSQFSLGLVIALVSAFLFFVAAWGLYVLLKPVNQPLALLFLLLNAVGVGIQCVSMFPLVFAILLGRDASGLMQAFSAAQLEGLSQMSISLYKSTFVLAQLFFGTWLFPLGYLVYKSRFLPKFLGVLLILDGVAVLFWFFQAMLLPGYPMLAYPGLALSLVAEAGLGLWLLVKGVKNVGSE